MTVLQLLLAAPLLIVAICLNIRLARAEVGRTNLFGVLPALFLTVSVIGLVCYGYLEWQVTAADAFYDLGVTSAELCDAFNHTLVAIIALELGLLTGKKLIRIRAPAAVIPRRERRSTGTALAALSIALALATAITYAVGFGMENLFARDFYLPETASFALTIGATLGPLAFVLLGFAWSRAGNGAARIAVVLAFVLLEALFLALAKRLFAVGPVLFLLSTLDFRHLRPKEVMAKALLATLLILVLAPLPLLLRDQTNQGLIPFIQILASAPEAALNAVSDGLRGTLLNFSFSLPITAYVVEHAQIATDYLVIALNPLPGWAAGWNEEAIQELRYSIYIPYNSIGELLRHSPLIAIVYFSAVGLVFAAIYRFQQSRSNSIFWTSVVLGFSFFYAYSCLQYNLRSSTRIVWYLVLICGVASIAARLHRQRRR